MDIEIRKLTPDLLDDYLHFFETDAHADNPDEVRCYCVCWCSADHRVPTDFSSPEKRRELAVQYVNGGIIQGYLAYHDGRVVGWCNANDRSGCTHCVSWMRITRFGDVIEEPSPSARIKSLYCFAIAPNMKRKGLATLLLERVIKDAADERYDYVEAYPFKEFRNQFDDFMGPLALYERFEFGLHEQMTHRFIMRKPLRQGEAVI